MAEKIFEKQVNYGWGLSLNMTGKAPAIAKRIWETYNDALEYVNDFNDSAIEGLQLSVVNDPDTEKNGIYFVEKIGTFTEDENGEKQRNDDGKIVKVGGMDVDIETAEDPDINSIFGGSVTPVLAQFSSGNNGLILQFEKLDGADTSDDYNVYIGDTKCVIDRFTVGPYGFTIVIGNVDPESLNKGVYISANTPYGETIKSEFTNITTIAEDIV